MGRPKPNPLLVLSKKSKLELTLETQLRQVQIPFEREFEYVPGRKYRADFKLPYGVLVECDGGLDLDFGGHTGKDAIVRDMLKQNLAVLHGYLPLRFDWQAIKSGSALIMIQAVLIKLKHDATQKDVGQTAS